MKIDIENAPQLRNLIDTLLSDVSTRQVIEKIEPTEFRVTSPDTIASFTVSKDELLAVVQWRIDASMIALAQRYQLDFKKANVNAVAPALPGVDLAVARAEGMEQPA